MAAIQHVTKREVYLESWEQDDEALPPTYLSLPLEVHQFTPQSCQLIPTKENLQNALDCIQLGVLPDVDVVKKNMPNAWWILVPLVASAVLSSYTPLSQEQKGGSFFQLKEALTPGLPKEAQLLFDLVDRIRQRKWY